MEDKVEKYYKREARDLVDMMFDKGFIANDCSRKAMRALEEYIGYVLQSKVKSAIKVHDLLKQVK